MVMFNHSCGIFRPAKERSRDDILGGKNDGYLFIALPEKIPERMLYFTNQLPTILLKELHHSSLKCSYPREKARNFLMVYKSISTLRERK